MILKQEVADPLLMNRPSVNTDEIDQTLIKATGWLILCFLVT